MGLRSCVCKKGYPKFMLKYNTVVDLVQLMNLITQFILPYFPSISSFLYKLSKQLYSLHYSVDVNCYVNGWFVHVLQSCV